MSEMEPIVGSRGQVFSVAGSPLAGFEVHGAVAERVNSSPKLLDVGEMGVYSSYTPAPPIDLRLKIPLK
jgi:hypothetical protein